MSYDHDFTTWMNVHEAALFGYFGVFGFDAFFCSCVFL
jgi:hypothetical protein